ncbi:MAG: hypothetical protein CVT72_11485 [Alphaproteobacteria bacterium HGW-Alphaproteobacteria-11]|nr:MAG: hypothetical protein CVT72_11485 [Alphaproteobacteria bacterium HGW-Alphaproteobacteria-11]
MRDEQERFVNSNGPTAVTVIVCAFNAAATIFATLVSLRAQTHQVLEILIINDGSTDATNEIVRQQAEEDGRIRMLDNDGNRGTAYSRQRGLEEASNDLVMFFDADDLAEPDLVNSQIRLIESDKRILGVGCYARYFSDVSEDTDLGLQRIGPTNREEFMTLYRNNKLMFMVPVTLFKRGHALTVGGYRQKLMPNPQGTRYEDFAEDLDLWCRLSDLGVEGMYFITIPKPLFRYRKPVDSLSTRNLKFMQLKMRWIKDCLCRRRAGIPERTLEAFIASRGAVDRFLDWRADIGAGFFRRGAFAYSRRDYPALAFFLMLAGIASPKLLIQKFRTQRMGR